MKVRGITLLTRKALVTHMYGTDAWTSLYNDVARSHPCLRSLITPDALVPLPAFLGFHDELMRRFFQSDGAAHIALGRQVGRWALNDGPFRALKEKQDLPSLVDSIPMLHQMYFADTTTRSEAALVGGGVEFKVVDLPEWHLYFEYLIIGYVTEILELYCANPICAVRLHGGGTRNYAYLLCSCLPAEPDAELRATSSRAEHMHDAVTNAPFQRLSGREMDVLLLIARGKTNDEIGAELGVSAKTAQHHAARVYRKIGVSGRVGAALWLAKQHLSGE